MFLNFDIRPLAIFCLSICLDRELVVEAQLAQWISPYLPLPNSVAATETGLVYRQRETLNSSDFGYFGILEWVVDRNQSMVFFNLITSGSASTGGNVLVVGLSRTGNVTGADLVGVTMEQPSSLMDMYGTGDNTIERDIQQNWKLDGVTSMPNGESSISFSRSLVTCDGEQDIPINNDMLYIIWGYGAENLTENQATLTFTSQGSVRAYIADPQKPRPNQVQTWRVSRSFQLPAGRHTSYWCNIKKGPVLPTRHHIIGYVPYFSNSTSELHVHHQLVYRCVAPPGVDPAHIFDRFVSHPGEECYLELPHQLPTHLCTEIVHTWGVGGKSFNFPENVGISLGETPNEYFLFESHYDNPQMLGNVTVENGVDFLYSPEIRPVEGGIIFVGSGVLGLYMVPPNSANFTIGGLCSAECTTKMLAGISGGGTSILATMLHAHMSTQQIRMRHFRGDQELPWVQSDENYDFSFQQTRHLNEPVKVLPGDQLGVECVMDTRDRNGSTVSGFSTKDEMCVTFVLIDKRLGYLYCSSEYPTNMTLERYGVQNVTWNRELQERVINQAVGHPEWEGRLFQEVVDEVEEGIWTEDRRRDLEREQIYERHDAICPPVRKMAMLAYASYFAEGVTKGILSFTGQIEMNRPDTTKVSTPDLDVKESRWPTPVNSYQPGNSGQC